EPNAARTVDLPDEALDVAQGRSRAAVEPLGERSPLLLLRDEQAGARGRDGLDLVLDVGAETRALRGEPGRREQRRTRRRVLERRWLVHDDADPLAGDRHRRRHLPLGWRRQRLSEIVDLTVLPDDE